MAHNDRRSGQYPQNRDDDKDRFDLKAFNEGYKGWIQKEFMSETIDFAEKFGEYLVKNRLTTSQIRNIYGEVKRIESKVVPNEDFSNGYKDFLLLKPKLAYAAKRAGTRGIEVFKEVMDKAHSAVVSLPDPERFKAFLNFTDLFEAILAYHKAAGGRE